MGTCPVVAPWVTGGKERDRRFLKCIYAASHHGNELRRKCVEGQRAFSMAFNSMCHMCIVFRDSRREKNILGCFFFRCSFTHLVNVFWIYTFLLKLRLYSESTGLDDGALCK